MAAMALVATHPRCRYRPLSRGVPVPVPVFDRLIVGLKHLHVGMRVNQRTSSKVHTAQRSESEWILFSVELRYFSGSLRSFNGSPLLFLKVSLFCPKRLAVQAKRQAISEASQEQRKRMLYNIHPTIQFLQHDDSETQRPAATILTLNVLK